MTYYRHTDTNNPMSDWGHAMFSEEKDNTFRGKEYHWSFDGAKAVAVEELYSAITEAWNNQDADEREDGLNGDYDLAELTAEQVCKELNPEDIVDSARGYDNDLACWFWANVLEPMDIMAVITQDGAVVFDETLIEAYEMEDAE